MITKIIGSIFLLLSALILYFLMISKEKESIETKKAFYKLLNILKVEIDLYCKPLYQILNKVDVKILEKCNYQFTDKGFDAEISMNLFIKNCKIEDKNFNQILTSFSESFGKAYKTEQVKLLEKVEKEIEESQKKQEEDLPKKKKVYFALIFGFCLSLILIII